MDYPAAMNSADDRVLTSDVTSFQSMASVWSSLLDQQRADVSESWIRAAAAMSTVRNNLARSGEWVSGPSSLMEILGISRAEVINCRMVRWLFDPLARHGLGTKMIQSLARHLEVEIDSPELAVLSVEVAIADTRADIVLSCADRTIVFEAKIDAGEQDLQARRIEAHWPEADPLIFLATGSRRLPRTAGDIDRWRSLSWTWIAETAEHHLRGQRTDVDECTASARSAVAIWAESTRRSLR